MSFACKRLFCADVESSPAVFSFEIDVCALGFCPINLRYAPGSHAVNQRHSEEFLIGLGFLHIFGETGKHHMPVKVAIFPEFIRLDYLESICKNSRSRHNFTVADYIDTYF